MILIETNVKDFFQDRLAVVELIDNTLVLTFDKPFLKFKHGDSLSVEFTSAHELLYIKKELKAKSFPYEIYSEFILEDVYNFLRKL